MGSNKPTNHDATRAPPPASADAPAGAERAGSADSLASGPIGSRIGPYLLLAELGAGGMGAVYLAEQQQPVRRQVALKLIHAGMETADLTRRFQSERELLARMNHPNIAQVLDVGATDSGRLYFAMEYVPGVPLSDFCDRRGLDLRGRLELFLQACEGVQHAHQKGVIHRDLKPSNLMVADYHGQWLVKVIDFGIAKGIDDFGRLEPGTTRLGTPIGTPAYMSPEQARGDPGAVDTRTDVYALGGVLYKLLTDETPLPAELLSRSTELDFANLLERTPVEPPSRRVRRLSRIDDSEWKRRMSADYTTHARRLQRDLDWIVLKALEQDRNRRYASVSELAADLRRHLHGEPVLASPPGAGYRIGKFVRRHRIAVGAGSAVAVALVAGIVGTSWMAVEAQRQRAGAEQARDQAELERRRAVAVGGFLEQMIAAPDPWKLQGARLDAREVRVVDVLADAVGDFEQGIGRDPALFADIGTLLGRSLRRLGSIDRAREVLRAAEQAGSGDRDGVNAELALVLAEGGDLEQAAGRFDRLVAAGALARLPSELADEVRRAHAEVALGRDDPQTAEQLARDTLAYTIARDGEDGTSVSGARSSLAWILGARGQWEEAEALAEAAHQAERRRLGPTHPVSLHLLGATAGLYLRKGDFEEAIRRYRDASVGARQVLGDDHPTTLGFRSLMAAALDNSGRHAEASVEFAAILPRYRERLGEEHPEVLTARYNGAAALRGAGQIDGAETEWNAVLATQQRTLGPSHADSLRTMTALAVIARDRGDLLRAQSLMGQVADIHSQVHGERHPESIAIRNNQLALMLERGDLAEAISRYRSLQSTALDALPDGHLLRAVIQIQFATALARHGDAAEAEPLILAAYRSLKANYPADDPRVPWARRRAEEILRLSGGSPDSLDD
jgi:eukaryotic-like serine/threonine-protein kinase